ncbi:hypothetical protein ACWC24_03930 [Streptomyces sp. NPDC001443]
MRKLGWGLWWLSLVFAVAVVGRFVWVLSFASSDGPPGTVGRVSCDRALRFAGASLPAGASAQDCTSYSWPDQAYDGSFRMPRSTVPQWLTAAFPRGQRPEMCDGDLCVFVRNAPDDKNTTGAYDVDVSVRYEGGSAGNTALVTFEASTY